MLDSTSSIPSALSWGPWFDISTNVRLSLTPPVGIPCGKNGTRGIDGFFPHVITRSPTIAKVPLIPLPLAIQTWAGRRIQELDLEGPSLSWLPCISQSCSLSCKCSVNLGSNPSRPPPRLLRSDQTLADESYDRCFAVRLLRASKGLRAPVPPMAFGVIAFCH